MWYLEYVVSGLALTVVADTPAILIIDDENSVQITQGNLESEHMLDIVSSSSENESREDSQGMQ
jgi:hypothetical protein